MTNGAGLAVVIWLNKLSYFSVRLVDVWLSANIVLPPFPPLLRRDPPGWSTFHQPELSLSNRRNQSMQEATHLDSTASISS